MEGKEVANNLETPDPGQGEETGEETNLEQPEVQAQEEEEGEGKGTPDDPKLLRSKMTQATQRASEVQKQFDEYKSRMDRILAHPKFKQIADEVESGPEAQEKPASLKFAEMSDEQKAAYKTLKPFIETMLEEMGVLPKLAQIENYTLTSAQRESLREQNALLDNFYTKHPEAKTDETVNQAIANIINNGLRNGERISLDNAWKIYTSDSAESKAKQKILEETKLKKEATLPKPKSATPAPIQTGRMSTRQAVERALEGDNY